MCNRNKLFNETYYLQPWNPIELLNDMKQV